MTDLMLAYKHLEAWTQVQLLDRHRTLVGAAPNGDYRGLSDEALQELVAISRVLRRKVSTSRPPSRSKGPATVPTLDMI